MKVLIVCLALSSALWANSTKICLFIPEKFVSEALQRTFKNEGYTNVIDDRVQLHEIKEYINAEDPDVIIVDGSGLDSIDKQLQYESQVIDASRRVDKLLLLSSFDIYPKKHFPYREGMINEKTIDNVKEPYAIAKLSCFAKCHALNDPQKPKYILCIYPYLYGTNAPKSLSAPLYVIIDRIMSAKKNNRNFTVIPNDGTAQYDILHIDDFAKALVNIVEAPKKDEVINISTSTDQSTEDLTALVKKASGYTGDVILDVNCYDAVERRVLDNKKIRELGWIPTVTLQNGLRDACK